MRLAVALVCVNSSLTLSCAPSLTERRRGRFVSVSASNQSTTPSSRQIDTSYIATPFEATRGPRGVTKRVGLRPRRCPVCLLCFVRWRQTRRDNSESAEAPPTLRQYTCDRATLRAAPNPRLASRPYRHRAGFGRNSFATERACACSAVRGCAERADAVGEATFRRSPFGEGHRTRAGERGGRAAAASLTGAPATLFA